MEKKIYDLLRKIEESNHQAYLVGGYPRDFYLGKATHDYDVCTSATTEVLKQIFPEILEENVGSLKIQYDNITVEVTTFRVEKYEFSRIPIVSFTTSLEKDLERRDFVINTLCMNKEELYLDYLNAREDLNNKVIRSVGNPFIKMKEDPLRILRAIRFATTLNFQIEDYLKKAIYENRHLVANLSYYRKKEELNKILSSENCHYGISLLQSYGLDSILECKFTTFTKVSDLEGMWAQFCYSSNYPFSKKERKKITIIRNLISKEKLENKDLYYYGLDFTSIVAQIKGESLETLEERYHLLPIHSRKDIQIDAVTIHSITNKNASIVYPLLECEILEHHLENDRENIEKFLMEYFCFKEIR